MNGESKIASDERCEPQTRHAPSPFCFLRSGQDNDCCLEPRVASPNEAFKTVIKN
jgi:hypothetical protein